MQEFIVCKGLPASGKTTYARKWVEEDPKNRVRVNRDDIRRSLGPYWIPSREDLVTTIEDSIIRDSLLSGFSVISDNTNFREKYNEVWFRKFGLTGLNLTVKEKDFTKTPIIECIKRDLLRPKKERVGAEVILNMVKKYMPFRYDTLSEEIEKLKKLRVPDNRVALMKNYEENTLPLCYIFDLDGTLSLMNGRDPYKGEDCLSDIPNYPVADILKELSANYKIFLFSGRNGESIKETTEWLKEHGIIYDVLAMRSPGDMRKDSIVKEEMYDKYIRDKFRVQGIFDDRNMMVDHWRSMGLPCFQVYYGDF